MNKRLPRWTPAALLIIAGSTQSLAAGLFGATLELSSLNGENGFVISGVHTSGFNGRFVSNAGDINDDGVDDLIIGAYFADASYVVFGAPGDGAGGTLELSSLNGANGFVINGAGTAGFIGWSVSNAGDINGDGVDDLIIGAPVAAPNGQYYAGASYVVFGAPGVGEGGTLELSSLNGANGFVINGIDADDLSGWSVSNAGDINGDGVDDLIIGAPEAYPNGVFQAGESYVVFGVPGIGAGGTLELASLNGANGFVIKGIDFSDQSGRSVSSAGDINGDGVDDLIIGAYRAGQIYAGASYVVFGAPGVGAGGTLELSSLNGANGFVINGVNGSDRSGWSVSNAGDINGDGVDDLIIGAPYADPNGQFYAGASYVVFGAPGVGAGGTLELSSLNGANGFVINGIDFFDSSGFSVSNAGDINGDGVDDLIIGAHTAGQGSEGASYVVFGAPGVGATGTLELASLNGANGFVISGVDTSGFSGRSVSNAGDINGDGVDDLIIGAFRAGKSYVIFGRSPCSADLNTDGVVDTADLGILLAQFNTNNPQADINNDGTVDTADLGVLLGAFGQTTCP